ncbi:MAG: peptidase T [Anaerolineaceae bacterium]|nr:peptidase T [Anaerolineaceae bacterium]
MELLDRFTRYIKIYTTSDPKSETVPTTSRQLDLAKVLCCDLKEIGIADARISESGYVYGSIPATPGYEVVPALGLIAHMDTAPDFCGENVKPQIIPNYDGGTVALGESGRELNPEMFPWLPSLKGRTLITTDGTTLLGADDKAGVTAIICAAESILKENRPHGKLCIAFTPDEEVGRGPDHFDVKDFGADFAYTVDGGPENEVSFDNFNAAAASVKVKGFSIHPGESKNKMINAALVLYEFNSMLPAGDTPRNTDGYEGFFHLTKISGDVDSAEGQYIIREHDKYLFEGRKKTMQHASDLLNEKYGEGTVMLTIKDQYRNMREIIEQYPFLMERADQAMISVGVTPEHTPTRGGTDGATLSFMGLPCPNLGTGGYAFHGPFEHVTLEGMEKCRDILLALVGLFAESGK